MSLLKKGDIQENKPEQSPAFVTAPVPGNPADIVSLLNEMAEKGYFLYPSYPIVRDTDEYIFMKASTQEQVIEALAGRFESNEERIRSVVREELGSSSSFKACYESV